MIRKKRLAAIKKSRFSIMPDFIADTVSKIDFATLSAMGIQAVFIDLDGTVVARSTFEVSDRIREALSGSGMKIYIATNRPKGRDLKNLIKDLGADGAVHPHFIFGKPTKRYFVNGLHDKHVEPHQTIMIGDRFIQDILGANRAGMYSLLVYKLDPPVNMVDRVISRVEKKLTLRISRDYE
jgi:uncharacterized protein